MPTKVISRRKTLSFPGIGICLMLAAGSVSANEPATYRAGIVELLPTLESELGNDSNLLNTNSNFKAVDTGYFKTDAAIQAWIQDGPNSYSLAYRLNDGRYFDSSEDDYTDHKLNLDIHLEANSKNSFDIYGEYDATHEARGTGFSEGIRAFLQENPFRYKDSLFGGQYTLGNRQSKGRLELAASWFNRQWDDEDAQLGGEIVNITDGRDHDISMLRGDFYWKVAAKTDLLFELRHNTINYDFVPPNTVSLDSTETFALVGVEWELTHKTTGIAKVGVSSKDFKADQRGDYTGATWDVGIAWEPRSYSTIELLLRGYPAETYEVGSFIDTRDYQISWDHNWLRKFGTSIDLVYQQLVFEGSFDNREDDVLYTLIRADYDFYRWLSLGVGYRFQEKDSSRNSLDYDRNQIFLSIALSL